MAGRRQPQQAPEAVGLDARWLASLLEAAGDDRRLRSLRSLLAAREGRTVFERYPRRGRGRGLRNIRSATKSVVSLLIGIAIEEGALGGVDEPLAAILPERFDGDPRRRRITVRHLLSQQAGLQWDEWAGRYRDARQMLRARDTVGFVLSRPMVEEPGTVFRYSTGTSQLLAAVLSRVTGTSLLAYARGRLFQPLGLGPVRWAATRDGLHLGGTHLFLNPRQLLRIGILCAQGGEWAGRPLVPAAWLAESTRVHAGQDWWEGPYGLGWWIRPHGYCAYGYGGQFVYIVAAERLVVVGTAGGLRPRHVLAADFERAVIDPFRVGIGPGGCNSTAPVTRWVAPQ
jgi:CubicO group peptidase (beta-lactamase class C family)